MAPGGGALTPDTPTLPRVDGPQGVGTHRPAWSPGLGRRGAAPGAPRPPPPPGMVFFPRKNLPPFFLLKIASLMAETNFTLGPTSKTNKFPLLFLVIVGQNSQHKRANLNGRTPLDIYSNNFRPSVKHVLGVLEWFYMLTEKILFQKSSLVFSLPSATPPLVW